MNPFEMVVAIIVIVTIGRIIRTKMQTDSVRGTRETEAEEIIRTREEIHALKERIAVLERVITNTHGSVDLDREIEKLRDTDRV